MRYGLGVDVGGTKIATVIINQHGEIIDRVEVPSNPSDKEKMFDQVTKSIENVLVKSKLDISMIEGMGVGVPGKVDRENGIAVFQNNLPWKNFPIVERLRNYYALENIVIDNDVYMAALAEWKASDSTSKDTFVYVTVSTGISCSIIQEGSFLRGNGFAGEIGLLPDLAKSSPNRMHSIEESASGPAIQKLAVDRFGYPNMTTEDFFKEFQKENPIAKGIMDEVAESIAHGIYSIVSLLDPHKIIFGGGVINNNPFLLNIVREALLKYLIPEQLSVLQRLQTSHFKENAGVVGAGLKGMEVNLKTTS
ncbi:ROK family protein [Virgibacillus necropolis]|uniref:ROK family protein n=1 Tax=Virgibacillus necropolis TaxID=163877 RepID=UPI00384E3F69